MALATPSGFGTQRFADSPFGVGYRDVVLTVGPLGARSVTASPLRARRLIARLEEAR